MKEFVSLLIVLVFGFSIEYINNCAAQDQSENLNRPKKIVLIAGDVDEGHVKGTHEYQKMALLFANDLKRLEKLLNFNVEVHFGGWPKDPATLHDADTILLVSNGSDRNPDDHPFLVGDRLAVIEKQMQRGCGLVMLHWSLFWPERNRDYLLSWVGGYFDYETGSKPRGWHSKIRTDRAKLLSIGNDHPVSRGVSDYELSSEELYFNMRFADHIGNTRTAIASVQFADQEPEKSEDAVVAWTMIRQLNSRLTPVDGRSFGFTGGHFFNNWQNENQRRMIGNAILWTAHIDPPPRGIQFAPNNQVKDTKVDVLDSEKINVALITGHQHPAHHWRDTSVALMNGLATDKRVAVDLIEEPEFLADPRLQDYDVVLFNYCNWGKPGLSESAQKGFVKFLKRGGGLVLIHFSNGAFHASLPETPDSDWPEFRKICRRVWDHSEGKSGHDAYGEFKVAISRKDHPITEGVESFPTLDELYYRQQGEEPIEILATAKSEISGNDEPIAFVYQYGHGRVFQTVLGHSAESLRVPEVAKLIRRSVAWTANREMENEIDDEADEFDDEYLSKWTPKQRRDSRFPYEDEDDDDWMDDRFQSMEKGRFVSSSIAVPGIGMIPKAIAVRLGEKRDSSILFDTETLNWRAGWQGEFLKFPPNRFGILAMPQIAGNDQFRIPENRGWRTVSDNKPIVLDKHQQQYLGLYLANDRIIFSYEVDGINIMDSCRQETGINNQLVIVRDLNFDPKNKEVLELPIVAVPGSEFRLAKELNTSGVAAGTLGPGWPPMNFVVSERGDDAALVGVCNGTIVLRDKYVGIQNTQDKATAETGMAVPGINAVSVFVWHGKKSELKNAHAACKPGLRDLRLCIDKPYASTKKDFYRTWFKNSEYSQEPGDDFFPLRWGAPLKTVGRKSKELDDGLVVDTITVPYENPHKALMFLSGVDFLSDDRAAVCTVHGDVWLVDGIDDDLNELTWQRFATGLYQPLGLRIVEEEIYVLGRDRITRLKDLDDDGEADFYENFDDQLEITGQPHGYAMSLETDRDGNFYFVKSGEFAPHGGTMLRLKPGKAIDGKPAENQLDVFATGYRHANGLGVSPTGIVTSADNEGNWIPSTRIDLVREGGFYGHMPTHRREQEPITFDGPLCWIPRELDNSAGGQVWATGESWGQLKDKMLHLSFGRCSLNLVLQQNIEGVDQAAVTRIPIQPFLSGSMRGRFNSKDGHLYIVGLDGWQTAAVRDGCFQRVRTTGKPHNLPAEFNVRRVGIEIKFTDPLDPATATNIKNWKIEQWNYHWTKEYGSEHYKVSNPNELGHDVVVINDANCSPDGKTVFLSIDNLVPVMQMSIEAELKSDSGTRIPLQIYNTINRVPK